MMSEARAARSRARALANVAAFLLILTPGLPARAQPVPLKDAPVPGWPPLRIEAHYVPRIAMRGYCLPVPAGTPIPEAPFDSCVRPDFWNGICHLFLNAHYAGVAQLRAHEERRCRGYDRLGSNFLAEALRIWRERGENRHADMIDFESLLFILEPPAVCGEGAGTCIDMR
jgi:hypothetical protein